MVEVAGGGECMSCAVGSCGFDIGFGAMRRAFGSVCERIIGLVERSDPMLGRSVSVVFVVCRRMCGCAGGERVAGVRCGCLPVGVLRVTQRSETASLMCW